MMISPESFYAMKLKGKTAEQIMTVIRGLKKEMGRLKNIVEDPRYECTMLPSEQVRISSLRDYLERAKQALAEAGGTYAPSAAERKAMEFDENIPFINKIEFYIGGYLNGYESKTYTIDGDKIHTHVAHPMTFNYLDIDEEIDNECFFEDLKDLHIGEWRRKYDTHRFGYAVLDGTQWHLEIYFSNGYKPVKICGDNAYPYNFDRVLEFFEIEE